MDGAVQRRGEGASPHVHIEYFLVKTEDSFINSLLLCSSGRMSSQYSLKVHTYEWTKDYCSRRMVGQHVFILFL